MTGTPEKAANEVNYPLGQQSFEQIRVGKYLYVDKTAFIEKIVKSGQYYFMGRPRRFGKSLFLSTLKCFFEGKRELFRGLYADSMQWDWEPYPVILLDLNTKRFKTDDKLDDLLLDFFNVHEEKFGIAHPDYEMGYSTRFARLIREAARITGKPVVILVDEYDKALVNNIHNRELFDYYRSTLAEIYSNFKSAADYIRLVFLTGVSRFAKLSVFSDLNNIRDISFSQEYAGICGISEEELLANFQEGIEALGEMYGTDREQTIAELKRRYDGYHFSFRSPDLYNPFSLLSVFSDNEYDNYWIRSGTPNLLLEQLKRTRADLQSLTKSRYVKDDLAGLDIDNIDPVALFYQTGYLTIKHFDARRQLYTLGIPNEEVAEGFYRFILPYYANLRQEKAAVFVFDFLQEMEEGRIDDFMGRLRSMLADSPYEMEMEEERNVQNVLFILFRLIGLNCNVEYHTSSGRIDILVRTPDFIYIMELKYDRTAEEALRQIEEKEYALPWSIDSRRIFAIGINYSKSTRTIDGWLAKEL